MACRLKFKLRSLDDRTFNAIRIVYECKRLDNFLLANIREEPEGDTRLLTVEELWEIARKENSSNPMISNGIAIYRNIEMPSESNPENGTRKVFIQRERNGNNFRCEFMSEKQLAWLILENEEEYTHPAITPRDFFATEEDWKLDFPNVEW